MPGILPSPSLTSLELLLAKTTTNNEGGKGGLGGGKKMTHQKIYGKNKGGKFWEYCSSNRNYNKFKEKKVEIQGKKRFWWW